MEKPLRKVTAKVQLSNCTVQGSSNASFRVQSQGSRPVSPTKAPSSVVRPKAKINSSATVGRKASTNRSNTPLARTPSRASVLASPSQPVNTSATTSTRSTLKPNTTHSPSSSISTASGLQQWSLPATASDMSPTTTANTRHESILLHHVASSSSLHDVTPSQSPISDHFPFGTAHQATPLEPGPMRIKSKVSGMAKSNGDISPSLSPSLPFSLSRPTHSRSRPPSISHFPSSSSTNSPSPSRTDQVLYPLATAAPATNSHPNKHQYSHSYSPGNNNSYPNTSNLSKLATKVDPTNVPLPPNSPSTSAVSFSSSSLSHSSVGSRSSIPTVSSFDGNHNRSPSILTSLDTLDAVNGISSLERRSSPNGYVSDNADGLHRKVKAEAKTNRKIADLEITNRSLLTINASLETSKHRQAKEIRDLRRKLRESRLILPPRAYRAIKANLDHDVTEDEDEEDETEQEDTSDHTAERKDDEVFKRIRLMVEGLIERGTRALETKPDDFSEGRKGSAKVLSADEVRNWQGSGSLDDKVPSIGGHLEQDTSRPVSPSLIVVPDGDDDFFFSNEIELSLLTPPRFPINIIPST